MCHHSPFLNHSVAVAFVLKFSVFLSVFGSPGGLYPTIDDEQVQDEQQRVNSYCHGTPHQAAMGQSVPNSSGAETSNRAGSRQTNRPAPGAGFAGNAQHANANFGHAQPPQRQQHLQYQGVVPSSGGAPQRKKKDNASKSKKHAPGAMFADDDHHHHHNEQQNVLTGQMPNCAANNAHCNYAQPPLLLHQQRQQSVPATPPRATTFYYYSHGQQQQMQPNIGLMSSAAGYSNQHNDGMAPTTNAVAFVTTNCAAAAVVMPVQQQQQQQQHLAQPPAAQFEPANLLLPEPIPDLLSDSVPSFQQHQSLMNSSMPMPSVSLAAVDSLMDQISIVHPTTTMEGTMEILYTEIKQQEDNKSGDSNGREMVWEIYRQRDNSGKFVKFRHVHKLSGHTLFSCVAPLPTKHKGLINLFFNNNTKVEHVFDATGYMLVPEEQFSVDPISGKPTVEANATRMYNKEGFQKWIAKAIDSLLKDKEAITPPVQPPEPVRPVNYPRGLVLQWVGLPLPVHPTLAVPHHRKVGFVNLDIKKLPTRTLTNNEPAQIMEQMDDGGNWLKIEVKQLQQQVEPGKSRPSKRPPKYSSAIFVRDTNGQLPNIAKPMVLFFNGHRWYFDKTGMSISRFGVEALRKWEEQQKRKANDKEMEKFLEKNRKRFVKERAKAEQEAAAKAASANVASAAQAVAVAQATTAAAMLAQQQHGGDNFMPNQQQQHLPIYNVTSSSPHTMVMVGHHAQQQQQQQLLQPVIDQQLSAQPQNQAAQHQQHPPPAGRIMAPQSYGYYMNPMNQQLNVHWENLRKMQMEQMQGQAVVDGRQTRRRNGLPERTAFPAHYN